MNYEEALSRLEYYAFAGPELLRGYANGPSRKDKWSVRCAQNRVLHRFARRISR